MKKMFGILVERLGIALMFSVTLAFPLLYVFYEFELISAKTLWICLSVATLAFLIICVVVSITFKNLHKKTSVGNWLSDNIAKLTLGHTLLIVFLFSIRAEVLLTMDEMKEIVSLGWTIFGISAAVFLLWNMVAIEYLEKRKPQKPASNTPIRTWLYIRDKGAFYRDATMTLNNVTLMMINLIGLSVVSVYIYISSREATAFSQCMAFLALLLSTNTIVGLFLDILKPFYEKKKLLLQETKVTDTEVALQIQIDRRTKETLTAVETINNLSNINMEEKEKIIRGILQDYYNMFEDSEDISTLEKVTP